MPIPLKLQFFHHIHDFEVSASWFSLVNSAIYVYLISQLISLKNRLWKQFKRAFTVLSCFCTSDVVICGSCAIVL